MQTPIPNPRKTYKVSVAQLTSSMLGCFDFSKKSKVSHLLVKLIVDLIPDIQIIFQKYCETVLHNVFKDFLASFG